MPFPKGKSGNPGGRPKALKSVEEAARSHSEAAIMTLARVCKDPKAPPAAQVAAATALLDRAWGRPKQDTRLRIVRAIEDLTDEELTALAQTDRAHLTIEARH